MHTVNFKIAFRNLWKHKGFTLINIGGLAIGLSCCLMLLLYVNYEWSYNKQFKDIDRIYMGKINLHANNKIYTTDASPVGMAWAAKQEIPGVEIAARLSNDNSRRLFSYQNNNFKFDAVNVDPSFLQIFDYHFIYGSSKNALKEPNSAVITASTSKKLFGEGSPLGKSIKWNNQKVLKVTGVIEDLPENQSLQFDVLQPWAFYEQNDPSVKTSAWGNIICSTYFKLKANSDVTAADASLRKLIKAKDKATILEAFLFPYHKLHLYNEFENGKNSGGRIDQVQLFFFLALCVLLIACINYMNLSTARSEKRAREVGVRKALGASRQTLISQFILESLLLSFIAMLFAFVLLEVALPYFNHLLNIYIKIDYSSYLFWSVLLALILLTGLLAGSYPAFYLSSFIPVKVLKGFTGTGRWSLPVRKILVVFQFTLSICMIICAIIIYTQIQYLKNKPLGFNQNNLVQMQIEGDMVKPGKIDVLASTLENQGAITTATQFSDSFTDGVQITSDVKWPGKAVNDKSIIAFRETGYHFSQTTGVKMIAGRDFSPAFVADTSHSVMLNEAAVKMMGLKNPIGTEITWDGLPELKVIGVVQDYYNEKSGARATPTIYNYSTAYNKTLLMRLNPAQPLSQSIEIIKSVSEQLNPAFPAELQFVSQSMEDKLQDEKILSVLSYSFGGFAIFISCLGLLGLALFMAEQRNKEISIRKVLGAQLGDILVLLNKDFMKLVILSNIIAFPLAYILAYNWLKKYDYKVSIAIWPFLIAAILSMLIAVVTVSLQTFKVAKANAVDALKNE
ncbi:ABC transporter permease [Pedobacter sp. L105]|uniref:ABC transporter permease n=1 Tax=Pedobacter sp. L105 TaxID=1641871 RepID=UPI00131B9A75|nr:ABC transporter permease [Pedobacter sp. L105]